jgi:hypothetical protein
MPLPKHPALLPGAKQEIQLVVKVFRLVHTERVNRRTASRRIRAQTGGRKTRGPKL